MLYCCNLVFASQSSIGAFGLLGLFSGQNFRLHLYFLVVSFDILRVWVAAGYLEIVRVEECLESSNGQQA